MGPINLVYDVKSNELVNSDYLIGNDTAVSSLFLNGPSNENLFKCTNSTVGSFTIDNRLDASRFFLHRGQCQASSSFKVSCSKNCSMHSQIDTGPFLTPFLLREGIGKVRYMNGL